MGLETIVNKHLKYTYDNGWRYEFWLKSEKRIVYGEYEYESPYSSILVLSTRE